MTLDGHEVIGHEVLCENGCFQKERYWIKGWVKTSHKQVQYVHGYSGRETVITVERITPNVTFEVVDR